MKHQKSMALCLRYMERHLCEPLSVADVAAYAGYSPAYFSRVFQRTYKISAGTWIRQRRMETAIAELQTGKSVTEAAHLCGFETSAGFNKAFRKRYGMTPTEYMQADTASRLKSGGRRQ